MSSSWLLQKRLSHCAVAHEYALGAVPGTTSAARFASHAVASPAAVALSYGYLASVVTPPDLFM